jgi:hypothetical protein
MRDKTEKQLPFTNPNYKATHLLTADGIARELRRVYLQYRKGLVNGAMAGKSTYILQQLNQVVALKELQERLDCLEQGKVYVPSHTGGDTDPENEPALIEGTAQRMDEPKPH